MTLGRRLLGCAMPLGIAVVSLLNANAISALVGTTLAPTDLVTPAAAATSARSPASTERSASAILARNPFDHTTGPLEGNPTYSDDAIDPRATSLCSGVRALMVVRGEDPSGSVAALDVGGKKIVRKTNGDAMGMRVAWIGRESVWLEKEGALCQAKVFTPAPPASTATPYTPSDSGEDPLAKQLAGKIVKVSPNEIHVDRGAVDRLLEAQTALMKTRLVPEKDGDKTLGIRVFGVKAGSVVSLLGIENGDRLETIAGVDATSPEKMLEIYARLRTGTLDHFALTLTRQGKPMQIDFQIR
jgi:general secretion pathway protein C